MHVSFHWRIKASFHCFQTFQSKTRIKDHVKAFTSLLQIELKHLTHRSSAGGVIFIINVIITPQVVKLTILRLTLAVEALLWHTSLSLQWELPASYVYMTNFSRVLISVAGLFCRRLLPTLIMLNLAFWDFFEFQKMIIHFGLCSLSLTYVQSIKRGLTKTLK